MTESSGNYLVAVRKHVYLNIDWRLGEKRRYVIYVNYVTSSTCKVCLRKESLTKAGANQMLMNAVEPVHENVNVQFGRGSFSNFFPCQIHRQNELRNRFLLQPANLANFDGVFSLNLRFISFSRN